MTKSTGPSKGSTGRMSTRTTNRRRPLAALLLAGALALTLPFVRQAPAFAAASKAGSAAGKNKDDKADDDNGGGKSLPPILQQALEEKEKQVTEARREAITLI